MKAFKSFDVGRTVGFVTSRQASVINIETVRVLHDEFAAAQEASTRTGFVAELGLNLVDAQWQVFVTAVEIFDQQSEHLFMGRAQ